MIHAAPRAVPGTLLFRNWTEARLLWDAVVTRLPRAHHLFLMPDHLHAKLFDEHYAAFQVALGAFAQARNRLRGEHGPVWEHGHRPTVIADAQKDRRTDRYILLNACRKGITDDPLSWPFSTLRDAVGLAIPSVRQPVSDPYRLMAYLCSDDHVRSGMAELPGGRGRAATLEEVEIAVSALTRAPPAILHVRGPTRTLLIRCCRTLTPASVSQTATFMGVSRRTVQRVPAGLDRSVMLVDRVIGSPRFRLLGAEDLRFTPAWTAYRNRR